MVVISQWNMSGAFVLEWMDGWIVGWCIFVVRILGTPGRVHV